MSVLQKLTKKPPRPPPVENPARSVVASGGVDGFPARTAAACRQRGAAAPSKVLVARVCVHVDRSLPHPVLPQASANALPPIGLNATLGPTRFPAQTRLGTTTAQPVQTAANHGAARPFLHEPSARARISLRASRPSTFTATAAFSELQPLVHTRAHTPGALVLRRISPLLQLGRQHADESISTAAALIRRGCELRVPQDRLDCDGAPCAGAVPGPL